MLHKADVVTGNKKNYTERNFTISVLSITFYGRSIKKDGIGSTCRGEKGNKKYVKVLSHNN